MIGNRVTEKDLRDWLTEQGFAGQFAKLNELELHAIEPPGWVQVFRFCVDMRSRGKEEPRPLETYWGIILDDERKSKPDRTIVQLFQKQQQQLRALNDLPENMIQAPSRQTSSSDFRYATLMLSLLVLGCLGLALAVQALGSWIGN